MKKNRDFSMMNYYTCEHVGEHYNINMPIIRSNDGESLSVMVSNVINQFSAGSKIVGITSDSGTNLAICKAILESTFEIMGVFDLVKPMFVMECLTHVIDNTCKAGVTDVQSDYVGVDTEVTRRNMQRCITCTKNHKRGKRLWIQRRSIWDLLVRGFLHLSKIVLII